MATSVGMFKIDKVHAIYFVSFKVILRGGKDV